MEYNKENEELINNDIQDTSNDKVLNKKDLNKMVWRSLLLQSSFNYERMQGGGWTYSIIPGLKKIHKNKKDLSNALQDHMQFFNTHPFLITFIQGVILAMEENKEKRETIRGIKVALMGPLGGIGDALFWLTLLPITGGIAASLSSEGNVAGPLLFLIAFNIVHFGLRFFLMHYGYGMGTKAISMLKEGTKKVSRAASIVGLTVVGALVASYINLRLDWTIQAGEIPVDIQGEVIDAIMPGLLPLLYTVFCYWLLKKGKSPLALIGMTIVVGLAGSLLGIM
ncbi:PTS N-acetylgalactosamine transporter subunit IID [Halolactibacillus miurensis]|uniref:PTS N-acetylgalactosamine transporter subunit IID n=1 Tax=Halolactibacillus miurensis TaxID=306541 RepID=A0A1I6P577_9BACI|nr:MULTISPECIES: PTS system mannose/fructose/sorbose family transporter subunit IID [Halolactibacillus]GEM03115.1 PTS N-acetylgalactosamine transporter subunit IID [Halolactibacillus miurensis]SFS35291.1 PTS system, N-acetylgalactosamine-specific IID component [Halolactibacillus miurensis]